MARRTADVHGRATLNARSRRSWVTGASVAGGVGVVADLPAVLTGALAVPMGQEFALGTAGLGAAIGACRATAALSSVPVGRLTDRLGSTNSLRLAAVAATVSAAAIALLATSWLLLTVGLVISGFAVAMGQPAANRLISLTVPAKRLSVAFGIKQSAPPTAALLAGVSVPVIALTLGWRWVFVVAAVLAVAMLPAIGRRPLPADRSVVVPPQPARPGQRPGLMLLGVGFCFGTAAATVVPAFYVVAAVRAGSSVQFAGVLLAVASAATVLVRLSMGVVAGRMATGHFRLCGALVATGALGLLLLGTGSARLMALGVVIAMPTIWGFNGVFWFAVVGLARDRPGTITGNMSPAGHVGGSLGPLLFGLVASSFGYPSTWLAWTGFALVAAASLFLAQMFLARQPEPDAA